MEKLLILRLGSMGDILHSLAGAAELRRNFPGAHIGWAVEERWSELLCAPESGSAPSGSPEKPLVDSLHFINAVAWRKKLWSGAMWNEAWSSMTGLRAAGYSTAVDFQGAWKSAGLALWSRALERVGFDSPRERPAALFYTLRVRTTAAHVVDQARDLAAAVTGKPAAQPCFPLPRSAAAERWCDAELHRCGISQFALFSPGAGWGAKLWPAESYAEVAAALDRRGLRTVINFGPGEDDLARAVEAGSGGAAQVLRCSLTQLIALTRRACIFVGGDSGPMHLAAALGIPVVAIFGPTDPARNGPYGTRSVILRHAESPTSYRHHDLPDEGLRSIPASEVIRSALRLLEEQLA